jgi:hypothetical protein
MKSQIQLLSIFSILLFYCAPKTQQFVGGNPPPMRTVIPSAANSAGSVNKTGNANSMESQVLSIPYELPKGAVQKGSFTAWTIPQQPVEGQAYTIVILIKHNSPSEGYSRSDISGSVRGTDAYWQTLSEGNTYSGPQSFVNENGTAKLEIRVPGASSLVQDIITIRSSILNETQTLELEFK